MARRVEMVQQIDRDVELATTSGATGFRRACVFAHPADACRFRLTQAGDEHPIGGCTHCKRNGIGC
jgi:hypothetical protein